MSHAKGGADDMTFMRASAGAALLSIALFAAAPAIADDQKLKESTQQVESGAKQIGSGVEDTAKGVGHTVAEGAKKVGDRFEESGKAAEPETKSAWNHVKDGASDFGHGVKNFFSRLFNK
jgi:hypothetical protein